MALGYVFFANGGVEVGPECLGIVADVAGFVRQMPESVEWDLLDGHQSDTGEQTH